MQHFKMWILPTIVGLTIFGFFIAIAYMFAVLIDMNNNTHNETLVNNVDTAAYMDAHTILQAASYNLDEQNAFCNAWNVLKLNVDTYSKAAGTLHRMYAERDRVKQQGLVLHASSPKAMNKLGTLLDEHCATVQYKPYEIFPV